MHAYATAFGGFIKKGSVEKMGKDAEKKTEEVQQDEAVRPERRFARYCLILLLTGATVLAWMAVMSFEPTDPPATVIYPPPAVRNAAGPAGAHIAFGLMYWLGRGGTFALLIVATISAGVMLLGGRINHLPWRMVGLAMMVAASATTSHILHPSTASAGGILGIGVGAALLKYMAGTGAWLVLATAFGISVMLMADSLVLKLPAMVGKLRLRPKPASFEEAVRRATARPGESSLRAAVAPSPRPVVKDEETRTKPKKTRSSLPVKVKAPSASGEYELPGMDLLSDPAGGYLESQESLVAEKRAILQQTLDDFGVDAQVVNHMTGPVISLLELSLAPGVKVSQISSLAPDIARALAVPGVRVVSPLPGRDTVGIEVPNLDKEIVRLKELMELSPDSAERLNLPLYLGKDAGGDPIVADLGAMPHMLLAGTTGSGKSVSINAMIAAILLTRTPEDVRMILIDPKMVEMAAFEKIPHLLCPIVNDMRRVEDILEWVAAKMDERYEMLKEAGVRNISGYNRLSKSELYKRFAAETAEEKTHVVTHMPYYVIIIDELADLVMTAAKEVEGHIIRIAQKARAVGIHMILATQRPSVNVVTGLIKSNIPCRASFRVASRQESRIILDQNGAEVLLGQGDMLFLQPGTSNLVRAQGTYVDEAEIRALVHHVRGNREPEYLGELVKIQTTSVDSDNGHRDEMFNEADEIILSSQRGSVSLLQRRLQVGYSRASRIVDQMAQAGILGDYKGSQARECMMTLEDWYALQHSIQADRSGSSAADGTPMSV
ncbi:MAG: DNA translocase FtsK 4TM domain-containing protein [Phycisphaerae bacterium]|nr:DNA translocase FtsK 4TM domain-containing protein [Phycisphaerae bacterium]